MWVKSYFIYFFYLFWEFKIHIFMINSIINNRIKFKYITKFVVMIYVIIIV